MLSREENPDAEEVSLALQKTAFQISKAINDVTPVTPKSLVSAVLLSHRISAVSLEDLLRLSLVLAEYVQASGNLLSVTQGEGLRRAIESTIRGLQKSGVVNVSSTVPRNYFCENKKRILLAYYKNNGIHCLISPSITMLAVVASLPADGSKTVTIRGGPRKSEAASGSAEVRVLFQSHGDFPLGNEAQPRLPSGWAGGYVDGF